VGRALLATIRNLNLAKTMAEIETGLENLEKPILFVWGMADPWLSSVTVEKLATKSGVELISLAEAKHYPQEHWSKEINPRIINFLGRKT
jgi:haloalkane dehalogenase